MRVARRKIDRRVQRAIRYFGNQLAFAAAIRKASGDPDYAITQSAISKYLRAVNPVPPGLAVWIHVATRGEVAFAEFHPAIARHVQVTTTPSTNEAAARPPAPTPARGSA